MSKMTTSLSENMRYLNKYLSVDTSFDIVYRVIRIGGRDACMYLIDGFCKDDLMQKMLQYFITIKEEDMPENAHEMSKTCIPYVEVDLQDDWDKIAYFIMSGVFALFIEGYDKCLLIDSRSYPARGVEEPEKDKVLRGSKDGFVETVVFNTALIRRRIRSNQLCMEMHHAGNSSQTDIVLCYMNDRVDHAFLSKLRERIDHIQVDALTMNQESLAECLYKKKWYNPFPKFKFTERPDTASAQILEGDVVILVDNSPSAMIAPTSIFDIVEEADDYYFPPITGTYLRLSRFLIAILTYFITPTFLLLMQRPEWIPAGFEFIAVKDPTNIPLVWQFLILELAIDGLRLAAVNTPNMLSTPLSVMAALVLGEFSVNRWSLRSMTTGGTPWRQPTRPGRHCRMTESSLLSARILPQEPSLLMRCVRNTRFPILPPPEPTIRLPRGRKTGLYVPTRSVSVCQIPSLAISWEVMPLISWGTKK